METKWDVIVDESLTKEYVKSLGENKPTDGNPPPRLIPWAIPMGYTYAHPLEGVKTSPSTPIAVAQDSGARSRP